MKKIKRLRSDKLLSNDRQGNLNQRDIRLELLKCVKNSTEERIEHTTSRVRDGSIKHPAGYQGLANANQAIAFISAKDIISEQEQLRSHKISEIKLENATHELKSK